MKQRSFLWTGLPALIMLLLQLTACDKQHLDSPGPGSKQPVNSSLAGFEIRDTLNPTLIDSSFAFNTDGTLASATDVLTHGVMNFSYHNGQRLSNADYTYVYDANSKLSAIALPAGPLGRDSLLLYPNGYIKVYRQASGTSQQGAELYMNYTYSYGGIIPAAGPVGDPYAIVGKGDVYDNAGNVTFIFTDSILISYVSTFDMGFIPLMTICNDSKVHFLNLRLWCNVPIVTASCIYQISRFTHNNVHIPGHGPVVTSTTDNFSYQYDGKLRPVWIFKNNIPAYGITYHD